MSVMPEQASDLPESERYCTCCERPLRGRLTWLEMNSRTGKYSAGGVPPEQSQGWFPFGPTCARKLVAEGV